MNKAVPLARSPASPALLSAIGRFAVQPGADALPDRRSAALGLPASDGLWRSPRSSRHLNRLLCQRLGTADSAELDWQRGEWRLALLSAPRLASLAEHLAAVVVAGDVRRALSRTEVCAWRDWLGQDAYEFAQTTAGLLPLAIAGAAAVRRRQVSARSVGVAWLDRASQPWPPALRARFLLKLPAPAAESLCTQDAAAATRLVHSVLAIVESHWCLSFAIKGR